MQLCRVTGNAVATVKAPALRDFKLLRVRAEEKGAVEFVAVDTLGAGEGDLVLVALGTAARELEATAGAPTDARVTERIAEHGDAMRGASCGSTGASQARRRSTCRRRDNAGRPVRFSGEGRTGRGARGVVEESSGRALPGIRKLTRERENRRTRRTAWRGRSAYPGYGSG